MVKAGLRNGYMLLFFLIAALVLNQVIIVGNDMIAEVMDLMLAGQSVEFRGFLVPLLWLILLGTAASYFKSISGSQYSARVQREVRRSLGEHLMRLPFFYFDKKGTGSIMSRLISDMEEMKRFFAEILPGLLMNVVTVATATVYLGEMDVRLILVLFACYPGMLVVAEKLSQKLAGLARKLRNYMDERTELAYDIIQGMVVSRSHNLYEWQKQKMDTVIDNMVEQACKSTRISSLAWTLRSLITTIPVIICYLFALYEVRQGRITVGQMVAFTVILSRILYPISNIVFCVTDIREVGVAMKRIQEIYAQPEEQFGGVIQKIPEDSDKNPVIEWKDVHFHYGETEENPVLKGVSFTVEAGQQTAFVGASGEGKTTIFKLLCGLYERGSGEYRLFGHAFEEWNLEGARKCFSEVSQNVFLLPDSIRENVACGKEDATDEEIIEACKNANIHDFIMQLPDGYETLVGERGVRLSGGQRQRISIARAFLKDAPILLLDEPTASVDMEAEEKIQEAIERIAKGRTVLVIAHRLSTIQNAEKIHVVKGGKIAESGTHQSLMQQQGLYAQMYTKG